MVLVKRATSWESPLCTLGWPIRGLAMHLPPHLPLTAPPLAHHISVCSMKGFCGQNWPPLFNLNLKMCSTRSTRIESGEEQWNRVMLSGWQLCKVGQSEMEWVSLPPKHIVTVSTPSITIQLLPDYHQIPLAITPSPLLHPFFPIVSSQY